MQRYDRIHIRQCILAFIAILVFAIAPPREARAAHAGNGALDDAGHVAGIHLAMRENWVSSWMMMTEQFVALMMHQMLILGTFLDAEHQLEVQRILQDMTAQAHKDFHPSFQMCQFGTGVKSLAAADRVGVENAKILDQVLASREHLNANQAASGGVAIDYTHRIAQFKNTYCDLNENNRDVELMCNSAAGPMDRRTRDIDYHRTVHYPYTLDVNYLDAQKTEDEKDIIALGRHLYASTTIDFMPEQLMNETAAQSLFMDVRSIHAIRSVARSSFAKIVGMKSEGDEDSHYEVAPFLHHIIEELGVPISEINSFLGQNPSYFAQMEVLTRKIYQSPEFYTNLYDKPANVRRMGVALQALELMQDRDRFESALRREMLISLILELKLRKYQEDMNSVIFAASEQKFGKPDL